MESKGPLAGLRVVDFSRVLAGRIAPRRFTISVRTWSRSSRRLNSEWSKWWGAVMEVDDRNGGVVRIPGRPWRFSEGELRHPGRPAFRGEHNAEVLKELGIADSEIARLEQKGAIVSAIPSVAS